MYMIVETFNWGAILFFIPIVFIGAFFLLNLTLAVIKAKFTEEHSKRKRKKKEDSQNQGKIILSITEKEK